MPPALPERDARLTDGRRRWGIVGVVRNSRRFSPPHLRGRLAPGDPRDRHGTQATRRPRYVNGNSEDALGHLVDRPPQLSDREQPLAAAAHNPEIWTHVLHEEFLAAAKRRARLLFPSETRSVLIADGSAPLSDPPDGVSGMLTRDGVFAARPSRMSGRYPAAHIGPATQDAASSDKSSSGGSSQGARARVGVVTQPSSPLVCDDRRRLGGPQEHDPGLAGRLPPWRQSRSEKLWHGRPIDGCVFV
jgi:hypothetical protein